MEQNKWSDKLFVVGWPFSKREVYPTDAELAEYLARMRDEYDQDIMGNRRSYVVLNLIKIEYIQTWNTGPRDLEDMEINMLITSK